MKKEEKLEEAKRLYKMANANERYMLESLFPELKELGDERVRKELIDYINRLTVTPNNIDRYNAWITWLEKQGEQKVPINDFKAKDWYVSKVDGKIHNIYNVGVEPKFQNGQWIVWQDKCYKVNYNGCRYELIDQNGLSTSLEHGTIDESAHLWDISDAKDGDVLAYVTDEEDLWIMIYWSLYEPYEGHVHYHALLVNNDFSDKGTCCICIDNLKPATKEQCDALMKAMTDAEYTFDFEKKELKKIEDEEYNGEDYGIDSLFHAQRILEKTLGKVDGYQSDDGILEHKCAISAVKKLYEQKPAAWSEVDKNFMYDTLSNLTELKDRYGEGYGNVGKCIDWLKSLKDMDGICR